MIETNQETGGRYAKFQRDGLLDIFVGMGILFAGLFLWSEMVWMAANNL